MHKHEIFDKLCSILKKRKKKRELIGEKKHLFKRRFNHTMIFFKLTDWYKTSDIYMNHNNCLGQMLIT